MTNTASEAHVFAASVYSDMCPSRNSTHRSRRRLVLCFALLSPELDLRTDMVSRSSPHFERWFCEETTSGGSHGCKNDTIYQKITTQRLSYTINPANYIRNITARQSTSTCTASSRNIRVGGSHAKIWGRVVSQPATRITKSASCRGSSFRTSTTQGHRLAFHQGLVIVAGLVRAGAVASQNHFHSVVRALWIVSVASLPPPRSHI